MMKIVENPGVIKEFDTNVSHIELRADGIVRIIMKDNVEVDIIESRKIFDIVSSFATKKELLVLVVGSKEATITKEAREFAGSDEASSVTIAEAIVTTSLSQKLIVNFLLNFFRPKREMKLFSNEHEALIWLYEFKEKLK